MVKKQNSFNAFIKDIFKRWWYLVTGIISGIISTISLIGINPTMSLTIGFIIFGICLFIAMYLAYRDLHFKLQLTMEKTKPILQYKKKLTNEDIFVIGNLENQMEHIHGHSDSIGIRQALKSGYSQDDVMESKCSICGTNRNQEGDHSYE